MEKEEFKTAIEGMLKARAAIVEKIGPYEGKKSGGAAGKIDCPVCAAKESLSYNRASSNGHIHAKCATEGCVRWME